MARQKKRTPLRKAYTRMASIPQQTFILMMARFDTLEKQNKEQLDFLQKHIELDNKVHDVVLKHTSYWNTVKWFVGPAGGLSILGAIIVYLTR
jgi:hypothetical protein